MLLNRNFGFELKDKCSVCGKVVRLTENGVVIDGYSYDKGTNDYAWKVRLPVCFSNTDGKCLAKELI